MTLTTPQNDCHLVHSSSDVKLKNFMLLEPSFVNLGVPLSSATVPQSQVPLHPLIVTVQARDIMDEKPGAAAKVAYQLFVILSKKAPVQPASVTVRC